MCTQTPNHAEPAKPPKRGGVTVPLPDGSLLLVDTLADLSPEELCLWNLQRAQKHQGLKARRLVAELRSELIRQRQQGSNQ